MPSAFQPLIPGSSTAGSHAHGKAAAGRDLKADFKPIGVTGESHLPSKATPPARSAPSPYPALGAQPTPIQPHAHHPPQPSHDTPAAPAPPRASAAITRLVRDGERITHIEVQCSCGELITLACGYDADGAVPG